MEIRDKCYICIYIDVRPHVSSPGAQLGQMGGV